MVQGREGGGNGVTVARSTTLRKQGSSEVMLNQFMDFVQATQVVLHPHVMETWFAQKEGSDQDMAALQLMTRATDVEANKGKQRIEEPCHESNPLPKVQRKGKKHGEASCSYTGGDNYEAGNGGFHEQIRGEQPPFLAFFFKKTNTRIAECIVN